MQQGFIQALLELEQWSGPQNVRKGRALVKRLVDFAYDIIAPFPLAFPAYALPTAPDRPLRRAVLDRRYAVPYEVRNTELVFVYAYSPYQQPESLELPGPEPAR
ncbi:hypothetical protein [Hymenobacter sp. PAMC 26628]|uniref:hypothetical protein n=1 Tax=Hymenobacter sp. PAMC 26628 TaxID=1484118 RepID=UPI00076FE249|nr:hypothetical protein [Hymenobacter sp. PAMC 26628]AMJ64137.1 hypothetical protein AXW84_00820 [Hymenobacter sp. PAMC 26628]